MYLTALATAHSRLRKISSLICICLRTKSENEAMTYQNEAAKVAVRMLSVQGPCVYTVIPTVDCVALANAQRYITLGKTTHTPSI